MFGSGERRSLVACACGLLALAGLAGAAAAQLTPEVTGEIAVLNRYVWRGGVLTDGFVVQPSLNVGVGGLSLGVWGNMDQDDVNARSGEFSELDYSADYTLGVGLVEASLGALVYSYTEDGVPGTVELYAGASVGVLASPSLTLYRDVDEGEGTYVSLGVGHSLPVGASSLDLAAAVGWADETHNAYNFGVEKGGVTDAGVTLSADLALSPFLTLRPTLGYAAFVAGELRDAAPEPGNFIFGVVLAGGF